MNINSKIERLICEDGCSQPGGRCRPCIKATRIKRMVLGEIRKLDGQIFISIQEYYNAIANLLKEKKS